MALQKKSSKVSEADISEYRGKLLDWYDRHRRDIPWRARTGQVPDPYHVWLSEIMCQQTTVQAVKAYYLKFLNKWPTVTHLANADTEEVMAAWAGLGYYARARNLHKCAKIVAHEMGGVFPDTQEALKKLPGIGEYTSAAIAAIAFNRPATVVDGNVERVIARFYSVQEALPKAKKRLSELAAGFYNGFTDRPGDLAQAFMDLGAGVCIPKAPRCPLCPLIDNCTGYKQGIAAELPRKDRKKPRPQKVGNVYWITNGNGEVLFETRPPKGLLGGMLGLPTTQWEEEQSHAHLPYIQDPTAMNLSVEHTFTHFDLKLTIYEARVTKVPETTAHQWLTVAQGGEMLPSVFSKVLKLAASKP